MDPSLREVVRRRAGDACEYCRMRSRRRPSFRFMSNTSYRGSTGAQTIPAAWRLPVTAATGTKGQTSRVSIPTREPWWHCSARVETSGPIALLFGGRDPWADARGSRDGSTAQQERPSACGTPQRMATELTVKRRVGRSGQLKTPRTAVRAKWLDRATGWAKTDLPSPEFEIRGFGALM